MMMTDEEAGAQWNDSKAGAGGSRQVLGQAPPGCLPFLYPERGEVFVLKIYIAIFSSVKGRGCRGEESRLTESAASFSLVCGNLDGDDSLHLQPVTKLKHSPLETNGDHFGAQTQPRPWMVGWTWLEMLIDLSVSARLS